MPIIRITLALAARAAALLATLAMGSAAIAMVPAPARAQAPSSTVWVAPERAARRVNPIPPTAETVKRGHDLFHRDCEQCHGKAGHGDGPTGLSLQPHPADLASVRVQSQSDGALFWKMTEGRAPMPKAMLSENEKWAVIRYIRTLATRH